MTICGRSGRLSLECPYRRRPPAGCCSRRGFFGVAFEVGAGGVEEQQVDLEVEQVGDGEEHRLLHLRLGRRPRSAGPSPDTPGPHPSRSGRGSPRRAWPTRPRTASSAGRRAVGDQREQHPLDVGGEPAAAQHLAAARCRRRAGATARRAATPPRAAGRQCTVSASPTASADVVAAGGLAEVAVDRRDQPAQPVRVEPVLPSEVEQHLRLRRRPRPDGCAPAARSARPLPSAFARVTSSASTCPQPTGSRCWQVNRDTTSRVPTRFGASRTPTTP